jgi:hypothetical protein
MNPQDQEMNRRDATKKHFHSQEQHFEKEDDKKRAGAGSSNELIRSWRHSCLKEGRSCERFLLFTTLLDLISASSE